MESMVNLRLQAVKVAASLKDVSSEHVIDVADKIVRYVKGKADIPETYDPTEEARKMMKDLIGNAEEKHKYKSSFFGSATEF